ncbi:MAG TPA: redoxin family protein [Verrucomicrobiae bacterium]|nr:redoxin family protein [Verrucomicrobiae bacterium]
MAGDFAISKKLMLVLMGGVLAASFLGIFAGTSFTEWNSTRKRDARMKEKMLLKAGQSFPHGSFIDMEGKSFNLEKALEGKKTFLIFFTTECPHCTDALQKWVEYYPNRDSEYEVAAISYEPVDKLRRYKEERNLSIPVFNDSIGKFTGNYKIEVYPTIIGVNEHREIAFVEIGNNPKKSVGDYLRGL